MPGHLLACQGSLAAEIGPGFVDLEVYAISEALEETECENLSSLLYETVRPRAYTMLGALSA